MCAKLKKAAEKSPKEPEKNRRGAYNSTTKSLIDIWNVLAAHASAERPLTTGEIFRYLNPGGDTEDNLLENETKPSRNTLTKHFPADADVINTLFPNTVLCEAGKPAVLHTYGHDGKLHVVLENANGDALKNCEMQAVFLRRPSAPIPQSTLNRKLPQLYMEYESASVPEQLPVSLAGIVAVKKGLTTQYIPASEWAPAAKKEDPPKQEDSTKANSQQDSEMKAVSPPRRYYLSSILSPAKWRILSDLILVYPYIDEQETRDLLSAMQRLAPGVRNWSGARYARKTAAPLQFQHIEILDKAIRERKKVSITYGKYTLYRENGAWKPRLVRQDGAPMLVSPYAMMWSNGYYYLVCRLEDGSMRNLRVDRILDVNTFKASGDDYTFTVDKDFDPVAYRDRSPIMYPGEPVPTRLRCHTKLLSTLMDIFGSSVTGYSTPKDDYTVVSLRASESGTRLFALQYADLVDVLEPQSLREEVQRTLQAAAKRYESPE
ncbi:WYL domain-containing protein [Oscillibacter valericigenes]|uniref:helix-turn-helix transcriptional regulator n=1 Tax=Oscillibacter valericigenes TaxID=351091 RepID=UPI001F2DBD22|nr:WYL domain-containing protein [Oscillibacter valericigenes]MCF2617567.1 WYL domain-containing protein [Oscillibacter valericigenes]